MLSVDPRADARQELYRDLVCSTAELVSRDLPVWEFLERAVELGKKFFNASSFEIRLREPDPRHEGEISALSAPRSEDYEALPSGVPVNTPDAPSMHAPIRLGNDVRGVISMARSGGVMFDELDASLFERWTQLLAVRIQERHLSAANARLEVLAGIDSLTGAANRRAFSELLRMAWDRSIARGLPLAIAMIDVDFFKLFNDEYGHVAGDTCLQQIAEAISLSLRVGDVLGRYGGEEFAVFFETASLEVAIEIAERLRENIVELGISHVGSRLGRVTASVGVAAAVPRVGDEPSALLERADVALYSAKERGRNRVDAETYVSASNAALSRHEARGNLPTPVSSFCGRHNDAGRIRAALADSRLATLTGFGGVGKTRLAIEVAHELSRGYRDGVWFVDLSGTRDPEVIAGLVASALRLDDPAAAGSAAALGERCRDKALLLVLDNCEHLKKACVTFATTMLRAAPNLRILATSREPLDAPEELIVPLAPFVVPEDARLSAREALRVPAIRLFVDRARAVTAFELHDVDVAAVVDLCRRVDGLALGIELAAARLKMLSLEQLRGKVERRLAVLGRHGSGIVARQQTLRALIDWSYDLLSPEERMVFRRLGIFAGSFTFEAASAICADVDSGQSVLDALDALVDKSLLVVESRREGVRTFRFFESIRSYARDRLFAENEVEAVDGQRRAYYLAAATTAAAIRATPQWLTALQPLEYAADDLHAVLDSTLGSGRDRSYGADLAAKLIGYWRWCGLALEGREWLECALRCDAQFSTDLRARIRLALFELHTESDAPCGKQLALETIDLLEGGCDEQLLRSAWYQAAQAYFSLGDLQRSRAYLQKVQDNPGADVLTLAAAYNLVGSIALIIGDHDGAIRFLTHADDLYRRINHGSICVTPLGNLAEVASAQGRYGDAINLAKRALASGERSRNRNRSWLLANLGNYYVDAQDCDSAASFTRDALRMALEMRHWTVAVNCCDTYARIAQERGDADFAACLLGYANRQISELDVPRQPVVCRQNAELTEWLHATLGREGAERRLAEGASFSCEAMFALVDRSADNLLVAST